MVTRRTAILPLAVALLLGVSADAAEGGKLLSVASARTAPTIDGQLQTNEWDSFAAGTGFEALHGGGVAELQPVFYVTFDTNRFLVAIRVPRGPGGKLRSNTTERDGALYNDDSLEIFLQPDPDGTTYYQFAVNAGGTALDAKGQDRGWNAVWDVRAKSTSASWSAEFAIPWKAVGCARAPGMVGFNIAWNCKSGVAGSYSWARMEQSFHDVKRFARLRLRDGGAAFLLTALGDWQAGTVALDVCLLNGDAPFGVTLKAEDGGQLRTVGTTLGREIVTVPLPMDGRFPKGGTYMLEYVCGAFAEGDLRLIVKPGIDVRVEKRMLAEEVDVRIDAEGLRGYSAGASLDIALSRESDGYIISRMTPRVGRRKLVTQTFDVRDFPAGTYQFTVTARAANGTLLTNGGVTLELSVEDPPWLGCREGITDHVLPPWTPVVPDREFIRVWGRDYAFASGVLPNGIRTRKREVLSGPIRLVCSAGGAEGKWRMGPVDLTDCTPAKAVLEARQETAGVIVDGRATVEYDGMIRLDLEVRPREKKEPRRKGRSKGKKKEEEKPTPISLQLVIPIKEKHARYLYHFPGRWGSAFNVGALPADGWSSVFKPYVWLGDEWRGLAWFCESNEHWRPADVAKAIRIVRNGRRVELVLDLLHQQVLKKPVTFTMALQATPVKPMKPDAWDYRIIHHGRYGLEKPAPPPSGSITRPAEGQINLDRESGDPMSPLARYAGLGVRTICFDEHWTPVQNSHIPGNPEALRALTNACHDNGIQLLLYWGYQMSDTHPGWDKYSAECLVRPRCGGYHRLPEQRAYTSCLNSPWQDYMAWSIAKTMDEFDIDGVYLDGTATPWACSNIHHGCGYVDADGERHPTYPIFAVRSMMRRIYAIVKSRNPRGQVNVHNSTMMVIPTLAWATSTWDGEQFGSIERGPQFDELLPLDAFRAEFTGQPWGVPAEFLCYNRPYTQYEALAFTLLHDVLVRPSDVHLVSRIWSAMDTFGRSKAAWMPYWENQDAVLCAPAAVKASVYSRREKGAMIIVSNLGSTPVEATIVLKPQRLHLPDGERKATDALTNHPISMAGPVLMIPLQPLAWRLVHIR